MQWIWVILWIIAALTFVQLLVLGSMGGIGPFGFIHKNKITKAPGNAAEYDFDKLVPMDGSPLAGMHICILGSSVAFGACSMEYGVGEYLAGRFGAKLTKEAVSGTTLVTARPNSYVQRLKNIPTDIKFDLFLCQLSTNDATLKCPLGDIRDENYDTRTVTGAIEHIIAYVKETWGCPVAFFTGSWYESREYATMVKRLLELKEKWDIIVLDLWSDDRFNSISDEERKLYMIDKIHPTKAGYQNWWGPEQERQLLENLL